MRIGAWSKYLERNTFGGPDGGAGGPPGQIDDDAHGVIAYDPPADHPTRTLASAK